MSLIFRQIRVLHVAVVAAVFLQPAGAGAAVLGIRASVEASVQEFIQGEPASFTADDGVTQPGGELFTAAAVQLDSTDLSGALVGVGQSFSDFSDPAAVDEPNPREFALEAACYSDDPGVSYRVLCGATEVREIVFVRAERDGIPRELDFGFESSADVQSRVFLSGAIMLWSLDGPAELSGDLRFSVERDDSGTTLFEAAVSVLGASSTPIVTGPLVLDDVSLRDLGEMGLDAESSGGLAELLEAGILRIVVIPTQSHPYRYQVRADQDLTLTARLSIELRNATGGTGVAAVLGRPFENLADFLADALPQIDGSKLQGAVNRAIAENNISPRPQPVRMCGAINGVSFAIAAAMQLSLLRRRARREPPP